MLCILLCVACYFSHLWSRPFHHVEISFNFIVFPTGKIIIMWYHPTYCTVLCYYSYDVATKVKRAEQWNIICYLFSCEKLTRLNCANFICSTCINGSVARAAHRKTGVLVRMEIFCSILVAFQLHHLLFIRCMIRMVITEVQVTLFFCILWSMKHHPILTGKWGYFWIYPSLVLWMASLRKWSHISPFSFLEMC